MVDLEYIPEYKGKDKRLKMRLDMISPFSKKSIRVGLFTEDRLYMLAAKPSLMRITVRGVE
jgi:hypothetical protein